MHWSYIANHITAQLFQNRIVLRVCYDAILSFFCLGAAFSAAILLDINNVLDQQYQYPVFEAFKTHFVSSGFVLSITTVLAFLLCGLYKKPPTNNNKLIRSLKLLIAITSAVLVFYVFLHVAPLEPPPIHEVVVLTWLFMAFFLAAPRITKYIMFRNVVFEASCRNGAKPTSVLVIGGAGYVGTCLVSQLLQKGYRVRILDLLLFGTNPLDQIIEHPKCELFVGDFRNAQTLIQATRDMDAIVHLGGIVGDPACSLDDDLTIDVNLTATTLLVETCKLMNISRLVFASSCSVYGQGEESCLTEESAVNPISLYARTKIAAEWVLLEQSSEHFLPTVLRFGTLFGLSARPRFDLVVNLLTAKAITDKRIQIFGGSQWRPFVHVKDASKAIVAVLEAPLSKVGSQIFNVGSNEMNCQIRAVGEMVASVVEDTELEIDNVKEDDRNYIVSFDKLEKILNIKLNTTILAGIEEIKLAFLQGRLKNADCAEYSNVVQTEKFFCDTINGTEVGVTETMNVGYKKTSKVFLQDRYCRNPPGFIRHAINP